MFASVNCFDLIGRPYKLGGGDGSIDCIQLVYEVLERLEIPTPEFQESWYSDSRITIARAFLSWGERVITPLYDGDVGLTSDPNPIFMVVWHSGVLYINKQSNAVAWSPIGKQKARWFRYCPLKKT